MIIDKKLIMRKSALSSTYSRGIDLFDDNKVIDISLKKIDDRDIKFISHVQGSGHNKYKSEIQLELLEGKFELCDFYCECPAFESYGGLCKHLVAVSFAINFQYDKEQLVDFLRDSHDNSAVVIDYDIDNEDYDEVKDDYYDDYGDSDEYIDSDIVNYMNNFNRKKTIGELLNINNNSNRKKELFKGAETASGRTFSADGRNTFQAKKSSRVLLEAITNYTTEERNKYCNNVSGLNINLEPILHIKRSGITVEWKIGKDKMYVLKNISKFVDAVRNGESVYYGKNLEFIHRREAFSDDSTKYVDYLLSNKYSFPSDYYYYSSNDKRYLSLEDNVIDSFIPLIKGKTVTAYKGENTRKVEIEIVDRDVKLPVNIKGNEADKTSEIIFPDVYVAEGMGTFYILYEDCLYCCSEKYCEKMKTVIPLLTYNAFNSYEWYINLDGRPNSLDLNEKDYQAFSDTLLPIMEKYMQLNVESVDFSKYEKEEGKYQVYLELDKNKAITCTAKAIYGDKNHNLISIANAKQTYRDLHSEYLLREVITKYFNQEKENRKKYILKDDDEVLADLIEYGVMELEQLAEVFVSDEFKKIKVFRAPKITTSLSVKGNLLNVSWDLDGMSVEELNDILASYSKKKKYHRLKSGELLNLTDDGIGFLSELKEDLRLTDAQIKEGMAELPLYRAMYLDSLVEENLSNIYVSKDSMFKNIISSFDVVKGEQFELPGDINAELRPYQYEGFKWANILAKLGFGGILADDMGLGKTLQIIAYLYSKRDKTSLVVCPASLVYNWESEFNKFTPDMKICAVAGTAEERRKIIESYNDYEVLITSYDLLKRDISYYKNIKFDNEIIDEAQYIKNPSTQAAKTVKSINSDTRFALTGTPIENRLSELWSIFEYLMPGYLFSYKSFKEKFEEKIVSKSSQNERNAVDRLHKMIKPFILRRLKKDVLKELPEKIEDVIYAKFENEQERIYKATEKKVITSLNGYSKKNFEENKLQILAELTRLRQICCDPSLIVENYKKDSAKMTACIELVENAVANGHKILLFSQFTTMLDLLKTKLQQHNLKVLMLTGSTSKKKRRDLVEQFQEGEADVFLISLKAGGTGLNLTSADIVIHYDPWWNVAAQNQATDRAHRIGQKNVVNVIKLIAKNSIEERILKLQDMKKELADKIISGENISMSSLSKEDLLELFE